MYGCIVCDEEDERRSRDSAPGEKKQKSFYTEEERDEALARIYSGEAYREHEEAKEEIMASRNPVVRSTRRRGNVKLEPVHTPSARYEEDDSDW